jgi:hypothetical protein
VRGEDVSPWIVASICRRVELEVQKGGMYTLAGGLHAVVERHEQAYDFHHVGVIAAIAWVIPVWLLDCV